MSGTLLAAVTGKKVGDGALVGTVAGGTLAFAYAWGKCFAYFTKISSVSSESYSATRSRTGYRPALGTVVKIGECGIEPAAVAPGDTPLMHASYQVMVPAGQDVTVKETVALKVYDPARNRFEEVGESSETIVVTPGQRRASSRVPIPSNAEEGKFLIVLKVEAQGRRDEREMPVMITRDRTILARARYHAGNPMVAGGSSSSGAETAGAAVTRAGGKGFGGGVHGYVIVTAARARIREKPEPSAKVVVTASKGQRFSLLGSKVSSGKKWHRIRFGNGKSAWITASTCKLSE